MSYQVVAHLKNPNSIPNYSGVDDYFCDIRCGHRHQTKVTAEHCKTKLMTQGASDWKWKSPAYSVTIEGRGR